MHARGDEQNHLALVHRLLELLFAVAAGIGEPVPHAADLGQARQVLLGGEGGHQEVAAPTGHSQSLQLNTGTGLRQMPEVARDLLPVGQGEVRSQVPALEELIRREDPLAPLGGAPGCTRGERRRDQDEDGQEPKDGSHGWLWRRRSGMGEAPR